VIPHGAGSIGGRCIEAGVRSSLADLHTDPTSIRGSNTMSDTVLVAETGRPTGSAASRRLRSEGSIPAVVYGQGMDPLTISVNRRDLRLALSGAAGMNTVLDLTVDGTVYPAIVKDIQRHPVRRTVSHVDFIQINLSESITVSVPLRLVGEAPEVENNNGLVDPAVDSIEVVTTPRLIPDEIVVDISEMTMDSVIRLADIELPEGVEATGDPDSTVVTVIALRAEPTAEELEDAAGETTGAATTETADEASEASDDASSDDDAG
jgi:large subunit ribosomal protein L25